MIYKSFGRTCFTIFNYLLLITASLLCLLPFVHMLALSLSSSAAVAAGKVGLVPVDFNLASYKFILETKDFFVAMWNSVVRVVLGVSLNLFLMVITAYPLSKSKDKLYGRNLYMIYFAITMMIGGGMIPTYLVVAKLGLLDSVWSLILPGALPVYNTVIMMNFIRNLPDELEEAAFVDGATPFQTLFKVMLPLLKPAIATMGLFSIVGHWNSWFDGIIYMNSRANYPLQSYLHVTLRSFEEIMQLAKQDYVLLLGMMNARTGRSAQLFLSALPIMLVYPFLQKYFTKGLVIGSVKG